MVGTGTFPGGDPGDADDEGPIPDILEDQRQLLLERRDKINEVIELLNHVLELGNYSDRSQLTDSMKLIRRENHSGSEVCGCVHRRAV